MYSSPLKKGPLSWFRLLVTLYAINCYTWYILYSQLKLLLKYWVFLRCSSRLCTTIYTIWSTLSLTHYRRTGQWTNWPRWKTLFLSCTHLSTDCQWRLYMTKKTHRNLNPWADLLLAALHVNFELNLSTFRNIKCHMSLCRSFLLYISICSSWSEASPQSKPLSALELTTESQWRLQETIPADIEVLPKSDSNVGLGEEDTSVSGLKPQSDPMKSDKPAPSSPGGVSATSLPSSYASGSSVICLECHMVYTIYCIHFFWETI